MTCKSDPFTWCKVASELGHGSVSVDQDSEPGATWYSRVVDIRHETEDTSKVSQNRAHGIVQLVYSYGNRTVRL